MSHGPRNRLGDSTHAPWHDLPDAADDAGPGLAERLDGPPHVVRLRTAMTVQPNDDLAVGGLYRSVHRLGYACAWMRQASQRQVGVVLLIPMDDVNRPVGRTRVDDDDLEDRYLLRPDSVQERGDSRRLVPAGNDNGHAVR